MGWDSRPFPGSARRADGTSAWIETSDCPAYTGGVPRPMRRPPATLAWILFLVGVVGLLLPWLFAPVMGDSRYHYPAAPGRFDNSILNLFPWTINDIERRMSSGRIVPVGMFAQHLEYLVGMKLAFTTGLPLFVVHSITKSVALLLVIGSFALLLAQLRRADGERVARGKRRTAVLVFTVLLVIGITATNPSRNGWTAYIVLCVGGIAFMFLVGAASLWVLHSWSRAGGVGKVLGGVGVALLAATVVLSYELHWAAIAFGTVLLALATWAPWKHRLVLLAALGGGWVATYGWTRYALAQNGGGGYVGLEMDLGGPVLKTLGLNLANAIPGTGVSRVIDDLGKGVPSPQPFGGTGWLWGLCLAAGFSLLVIRTDGASHAMGREDRQPLLALLAALAASALAAAAITSVSLQVHEIVTTFGATYRSTPWIWACLAGIITMALLALPAAPRSRRLALVVPPIALALLAGAVIWPSTVAAIRTQRAVDHYVIWEAAQAQLVTGATGPLAVDQRCELVDAWSQLNPKGYFATFLPTYEKSFKRQWNRPFCPQSRSGG